MSEPGLMLQIKKLGRKFRLLSSIDKDIEDKLSDKLQEELTKSFIDKKIILSRSLKQDLMLNTE